MAAYAVNDKIWYLDPLFDRTYTEDPYEYTGEPGFVIHIFNENDDDNYPLYVISLKQTINELDTKVIYVIDESQLEVRTENVI